MWQFMSAALLQDNEKCNGLERAWAGNVDPSIMQLLPVFDYQKCLNDLAAPSWLVNIFHCYLDAYTWPPSDKAQWQLIGTVSSKKWVRDQGKLELWILGMKSQRLADGGG